MQYRWTRVRTASVVLPPYCRLLIGIRMPAVPSTAIKPQLLSSSSVDHEFLLLPLSVAADSPMSHTQVNAAWSYGHVPFHCFMPDPFPQLHLLGVWASLNIAICAVLPVHALPNPSTRYTLPIHTSAAGRVGGSAGGGAAAQGTAYPPATANQPAHPRHQHVCFLRAKPHGRG